MSLRINTNVSAFNTHRILANNDMAVSRSLEKLSSGFRINRASDDSAGLSISETLRGQIGGLTQATANAQDGINLLNTAEGALNEVHSILQRLRDLSVQASNGTLTTSDRNAISSEASQLLSQIDQIGNTTQFNTKKLLDGSLDAAVNANNGLSAQIGANAGENLTFHVDMVLSTNAGYATHSAAGTGSNAVNLATMNLSIQSTAASFITVVDSAISAVSNMRGTLGALTNRLEHTINTLRISTENLHASESRIRDVDMADEVTSLTRNQILQQASTAMLAQANSQPQGVLSLLR